MLRRVTALGLCVAAALGCANHVRFSDEVREHEVRDVTQARTRIDASAPVAAAPALELLVSVDETVRVRRRETLVRLDEATPWRGRNELWEVPAGLVGVPFFFALRSTEKLTLGLIPKDFVAHGLDDSLDALNPAMNVASEARLRAREVSRHTRELEREDVRATRPLAGAPVVLALAGNPSVATESDAAGRVRIELLALLDGTPDVAPRSLRVDVAGCDARPGATLEVPLARPLRARLLEAARARSAARAPGASAESAAHALVALEALGFRDSARALERELRRREQADAAWLSRLDLALASD